MEQKQGLIAILDALGAASYDDQDISRFLSSRERVLAILQDKAHAKEVRGEIVGAEISTFTFNDTVLRARAKTSSPVFCPCCSRTSGGA